MYYCAKLYTSKIYKLFANFKTKCLRTKIVRVLCQYIKKKKYNKYYLLKIVEFSLLYKISRHHQIKEQNSSIRLTDQISFIANIYRYILNNNGTKV